MLPRLLATGGGRMIVLGCEEKVCVNYDKPEYRLLCQNCSRNFEDKFESPNSRQ